MFKAEVAQQDGGLADEFRKHLQPDSPLVLMMEDLPRESHDKSREVYNAVCVLVQRNGTHIMKSISAQNGSEVWRQKCVSCNSYTNGKANTVNTEHPRLEFRSENEFQHKLAENELIIKESENESQERVPLSQVSRCSRKVHRRQCQNTFASTQTSLTPTGRSSSVQQTFLVSKNTRPTPMEVGALVKAQVTKEEEAENGGNDKGKSPGKNGGKDKKGNKGDWKGKITFATWVKSCIRWVGTSTTDEY